MRRRGSIRALLLVALLGAGVWLYFTPHMAARKLQEAAERGDARALDALVDFPALRGSIKHNLRNTVSRTIAPRGGIGGSLGGMLAGAIADPVVELAVTPEGVAALTRGARPGGGDDEGSRGPRERDLKVERRYEGVSRFAFRFRERATGEERLALLFHRDGLAGWRLVGVRFGPE